MEVLLITGTSLISQDLCEKDDSRREGRLSANEQLEKACWDGLLQSLLPEIFEQSIRDNRLYLWDVKPAASFLQLDLAEAPAASEHRFSLNPHLFLASICNQ